MAPVAADLFRQAARLNREDPARRGNVVEIVPERNVIFTGDFHGNRMNFTRVVSHANLPSNPRTVLVLQEIIHGPLDERTGVDRSIELLMRAARLKVQNPGSVCFLMGNHDVAQLTGNEITKQGAGSIEMFNKGVAHSFPDDAEEIHRALGEFIESLPLAIRTPGGVMMSHSLPSPSRMDYADPAVFDRPYREEDLRRGGPVYEWTWGRKQTPEQVDALAEMLDVSLFLLGHRHVEAGMETVTDKAVTIASDHGRGMLVSFTSDETLNVEDVSQRARRIGALKK
jgi:hypothetical protein